MTYHVTVTARNTISSHGPEQRVQGGRLLAEEVPGRVVSRRRLGDLLVGARLDGVDEVGELNCVLDEKDGDIVANNVKAASKSVGLPPYRPLDSSSSDEVTYFPSSVKLALVRNGITSHSAERTLTI